MIMSHTLLFPVEEKDQIRITEHPGTKTWPALTDAIKQYDISYPFFFGDPATNIDPLFHLACLEAGVPPTEGSPYKLPLVLFTITTIKHDALIAPASLASVLLDACARSNTPVPFRHIFTFPVTAHAEQEPTSPASNGTIEMHTLPHPLQEYVKNT